LDVTRDLYNALLQERRDAYRLRKVKVTSKQQYAELTALRRPETQLDRRLGAVYRDCEDAMLRRLDLAFRAFFRRLRRSETPGFPRFKSRARWKQIQFSHGDRALRLDAKQHRVRIPGVGKVRFRRGRRIPDFGRAWIVERNGRWWACFEIEREPEVGATDVVVGVDRGVHVIAATSSGRLYRQAEGLARVRSIALNHQRELEAATVRDESGRVRNIVDLQRRKVALRLARAKEREANCRRDRAHKVARAIVDGAGTIAIERLNLRGMTRSARGSIENPGRNVATKAALNRVILASGFGLLRQMIVSKAEEAGKAVVEVDARFSSRECSNCGHIAKENRRRRRFRCVACGFRCHADVQAALVIRRRAQVALMSEPYPAEDAGRSEAAA
jgi:putative transposase